MKNTTEMEKQIIRLHNIIDAGVRYSKKDNIVLSGNSIRAIAEICGVNVMEWIRQQPTYIDGRGIRRPTIDLDYSTLVNEIKSLIPSTFYPKGGEQMEIDKVDYFFLRSTYIKEEVDFNNAIAPFYSRGPLFLDSKSRAIRWRELNGGDMKKMLQSVKQESND